MYNVYKSDIKFLQRALNNVDRIRDTILNFKVDFNSFNSSNDNKLYDNVYAFDLCIFYMIQLSYNISSLSSSSKSDLSREVDLGILEPFKDMLDSNHDYSCVNKVILQSYIQIFSSDSFREVIIKRINFCKGVLK